MPRAARRYDLYLPLTYNNGRPIPDTAFADVELRLVKQFGGLTSHQHEFPLKGIWQGTTRLYFDQVIVMTTLDFRTRGSARFIKQLKTTLLALFEQEEILVTESFLRVH